MAAGAGSVIGSQVSARVGCHRNPYPMPRQFAAALDHPLRLRYREPTETLGLYGFTPGMSVLDLGCGTGTFTVEMARLVGETGTVHALDLQRTFLNETRQRIDAAEFSDRVEFHHAGANSMPLPENSCDLVIMIATLSQIPERYDALLEVRRVLKPEGRLAVSEELPDPAYTPARVVKHWLEEAGFAIQGRSGNPFCYSTIAQNTK